jgi:hypothetical protein
MKIRLTLFIVLIQYKDDHLAVQNKDSFFGQ